MSVELRWIVPNTTFVPGKYPRLQYMEIIGWGVDFNGHTTGPVYSGWKDVPVEVIDEKDERA